ncbi:MAG: helix-turn-helix domain-containing protein [Clostridium sp.]
MASNLKICRLRKGYTQKQIASVLRISRPYYSQLENGIYPIDIDKLEELSKLLDFCIHEVIKCNCSKCQNKRKG